MTKKKATDRFREWFRLRRARRSTAETQATSLPPMSRGQQYFAMLVVFALGVGLTAFLLVDPLDLLASERPQSQGSETETAATPEQLYQCPMHPEVIEAQPSNCPICGMKNMPIDSGAASAGEVAASDPGQEREVLYWYAPMDPSYMRHEPGLSPMGMKLVPRYADETAAGPTIEIDPVQVQNTGVVSRPARRGELARTVRTVGILDFNADLITWVNTKFSGWIEKVHVNYVGQDVRRGEPLFEIYSPELVTTQEEYLRALEYKRSLEGSHRVEAREQAESLLRSTRDRLTYWDISEDQITALAEGHLVQRRLTIRAPVDGVVAQVMDEALEGLFVEAGVNLYKLADLSSVWVHADVYESDLPWVRKDQPAEVSFRFEPDRVFRGKILFLYPEVSQETRTLKICIQVPNAGRQLRAGMYTDVVIHGPSLSDVVMIPDSAVLRSGERDLVFIDLGEGRFEPREVELGIRGEGDVVQVTRGVAPGEAVVVQGQFMLDSESHVQEAIAKFMQGGSPGVPDSDPKQSEE
jgi:Cu(I)/Ag(I) efflux system membrane fusion protein/cobalt-zinc-cadmium efflux system membrane fusion protein